MEGGNRDKRKGRKKEAGEQIGRGRRTGESLLPNY